MPAPIDQAKLFAALRELGIPPEDLQVLPRLPFPQAQEKLRIMRQIARKNYKRLAFELHPDRTGNDPVKTEKFKLLGQILTDFDKIEVRPAPPPPPMPVRQPMPVQWVQVGRPIHFTTAASAATTTGVPFGPRFVVIMGPRF